MNEPSAWHPEAELIDHLDPAVSRAALEDLGEHTWGLALDWLYGTAARRPTAPDLYPDLRRAFFGASGGPGPAPSVGTTSREVLAEVGERLAPFTFAAQHPGSYSYFTPPPLPMGIAGETLASWFNQGLDVWLSGMAAPFVEEEVIRWMADLVGYGPDAWGVLTSGGVMANVMALAVARDVQLPTLLGLDAPPRAGRLDGLRVYASDQAHFSIERGLDLLGFPPETLRLLAADDRFRMPHDALADAIDQDRTDGLIPFCIAAVAGSTNSGAVDPVPELADLAERQGLWLHVDAAYGAAARFSPTVSAAVPGLERADSLTVDPHKWFFQPYDIGGLLVRRHDDLRSTFHREPEYYVVGPPGERPLHWYQYSLEGTRRFRALKLWLSWKHLGSEGFGRLIERTIDLAHHFARRAAELGFEVIDPELAVVCIRDVPDDLADRPELVDEYQRTLQRELEVAGAGWLSTTRLHGRTWLRAGVINYLSTERDADRILTTLRSASERVLEHVQAHGRIGPDHDAGDVETHRPGTDVT